jgi:hypothetical protein
VISTLFVYVAVFCFLLVPAGTCFLARANGASLGVALLLAFGPIVLLFGLYALAFSAPEMQAALSYVALALICLLNFWQAYSLAKTTLSERRP